MAYTSFDSFVANVRFRAARSHITTSTRICDVGCGLDAAFLVSNRAHFTFGVGVDYQRHWNTAVDFPNRVCSDIEIGLPFRSGAFDHVVMLAVLEHLTKPQLVLSEAFRILVPGGSLIMTWPSRAVDPILAVLHAIGLVSHEMESDNHQPRIPLQNLLTMLRGIGFDEFKHRRFELGLNNLLVARKPAEPVV